MKETDLNKHIDKIIIDGLIKEAQQENMDFQAAMRQMSNEDFLELILEQKEIDVPQVYEEAGIVIDIPQSFDKALPYSDTEIYEDSEMAMAQQHEEINVLEGRIFDLSNQNVVDDHPKTTSRHNIIFKKLMPWISAALAAAACILAIVIPTINIANGKLCESALMLSQSYMTTSKSSIDIANASVEEIKQRLPEIENAYNSCIRQEGKFTIYSPGLQEAGWDLTLAYLKLHKKDKALEVLRVLASQYKDTPFGRHCENLIVQLDY